jgi:Protein of unknown function (DUF1559)
MSAVGMGATSWLMIMLLGGGLGLPLGIPPLPEDPLLAKVAPEECLAYFASAGMAKPQAKSRNHTEQLFAEPQVQRLATEVETLIRTGLRESTKNQGPQARVLAEEGPALLKMFLTRPLAVYIAQVKLGPGSTPQINGGAVVHLGGGAATLKAALERCQSTLAPNQASEVTIEGTTFQRLTLGKDGPEVTWGIKGQYLYAATGPGELKALLKRAQGSPPTWLTQLHKQLPVARVSTVGMMNVQALIGVLAPLGGPQVGQVLEATGLDRVERMSGIAGLDKDGYVSRSLLSLRGKPQGLLRLVTQKPLTAEDLDIIPRDATFAFAWKLDAQQAWATILDTVEKINPRLREELGTRRNQSQRAGSGTTPGHATRLELIELLSKALGDTWCVFDSPSEGGAFTGVTAVVSIKDPAAAAAAQKRLLELAQSAGQGVQDPRRRPHIAHFDFAGKTVHVLDAREPGFPLAPAWCLTDTHLIVALYPEAVQAFLARGKAFQALTRSPEVALALAGEGKVVALSYIDTRRLFDMGYPFLPVLLHAFATQMRREGIEVPVGVLPSAGVIRRHLRPSVSTMRRTPAGIEFLSRQTIPGNFGASTIAIQMGLLLPAVQKVREAAARTQSSNNLKQIGLAMHNYLSSEGTFPPAYRAGKDGKALLSWRVLILPYLEQEGLYREFHLDEPWDSAHNRNLIERMPNVYRSPASAAGSGMTTYETVRGPGTVFPGSKGVKISDITDGTSNTIMVVEVSDLKAVIWTKPDDFAFDENNPADGLWMGPQGFLAAMCDGSVRFIRNSINPQVLRDLFIRNDGHAVPPDF